MPWDPTKTDDFLVCTACGTQFPETDRQKLTTCFICDDPRQFTPPGGQSFTTMAALRKQHKNVFETSPDGVLTSIRSEPKLAIGQRAILVRTPTGKNILWDCLTLLDAATLDLLRRLGGVAAIVISHPHYFSSHVEWAEALGCPVYLRQEDKEWTVQSSSHQIFLSGDNVHDILIDGKPTAKAIRLGGHFPGSQVLLYDQRLLIADTLVTTPSGMGSWKTDAVGNPRTRDRKLNSFAFMWSIPNMIPLAGDEVFAMWTILKEHDFVSTHGAFAGLDIYAADIKQRVLDSMQIQTRYSGWTEQSRWEGEGV